MSVVAFQAEIVNVDSAVKVKSRAGYAHIPIGGDLMYSIEQRPPQEIVALIPVIKCVHSSGGCSDQQQEEYPFDCLANRFHAGEEFPVIQSLCISRRQATAVSTSSGYSTGRRYRTEPTKTAWTSAKYIPGPAAKSHLHRLARDCQKPTSASA